MAHGAYLRGSQVAWETSDPVQGLEFWGMDQVIYDALRESGGTYSLGSTLTIGSSDPATKFLTVSAKFILAGTAATVNSGCTVTYAAGSHAVFATTADLAFNNGAAQYFNQDSTLSFSNTSFLTFNTGTSLIALAGSTVSLRGAVALTASSVTTFSAGAEIHGDATVANGANVAFASGAEIIMASGSDLTMSAGSDLNCSATAVFAGDTTQAGAHARTGSETISGSGATTAWRYVTCADANTTYGVDSGDYFRIPKTLSAGTTIYVLDTSPTPPTGAAMRFFRPASAGNNVQWEDGVGNIYATINTAIGFVEFVFDGGNWVCANWSANVTPTSTI